MPAQTNRRDDAPATRPVSVFTAATDLRHLNETYGSLAAQTFADWEWVVALGAKSGSWKPPVDDPRIVVVRGSAAQRTPGALLRAACEKAGGEILVEVRDGDRLASHGLQEIVATFAREPQASLVYSDFTALNPDGSPSLERFDEQMGWSYSAETIEGVTYERCRALPPFPHNVGYIWFAPNGVRAFRRDAYQAAGGYDDQLAVLEDHDLMIRLYLVGEFVHIDRCLYLERTGSRRRSVDLSDRVQEGTVVNYERHIHDLVRVWAERRKLALVRLRTPIWIGADPSPGWEDVLIHPDDPRLPFPADSVGAVQASDVLQRVSARTAFFNDCHRALAHAGMLFTQTPSTDGRGAFQDPSHTAHYNENSFMYYTQQALRPMVPGLNARLQLSHVRTHYPSETHETMDIPYVDANLLSVKDGGRLGGPLLC